jgi:DNA-binding FrmR family transcriptional regulator
MFEAKAEGRRIVQVDGNALGDVIRRLRRAEGQLRGVIAMLESGCDCVDVLTQLVAVSHAVNGAGFVIIADGLQRCAPTQRADEDQTLTVGQLEKLFLSLA